jgi:hypothetical protein
MSAETPRPDERLEQIARELRRPVALSPDLEKRVLRRIEGEGHAPLRHVRAARWVPWIAVAAVLVLAAGVTFRALHPPARPAPVALSSGVPRTVQFRLVSPASSRVTVVGDFNNWDPQASPLARGSDRGIWSVRIALPPGRYRYTFLVDGTHWVPDPSEPPAVGDDFDTPTSVITVAGGAT